MHKLILFGLIVFLASCRKDEEEAKLEGNWDMTFYQGVTWGTYGDSTYNVYPEDGITDWTFTEETVTFTSPSDTHPYRISGDTLYVNTVSTYERDYQILELTKQSLRLKETHDPYFPYHEIHFVKL